MIKIEDVCKRFKEKEVLKNVSMELEKGNIYGIVGRNGSGKTVLMKCLCGFLYPDSGTITVNEKEIGKDMDFLENAGIIIETPGFISHYTGMQNLKNLASIQGKIEKENIE